MHWNEIPADALAVLRRGAVIPAHLLALDAGIARLGRRLGWTRPVAEMASSWAYLILVELDGGAGGGTGGGAGGEEAYLPSLPPGASWLHAERRRSASLAAAIRRAASSSTASRPS